VITLFLPLVPLLIVVALPVTFVSYLRFGVVPACLPRYRWACPVLHPALFTFCVCSKRGAM